MGMADDILLNKYKNKSMANDILSGNYTRRQNIRTVNDVANRFWNANNQVVGTFKNIGREKQAKSKAEFEALLESQAGEPLGITKDNQMFKAGAFSNGYQPWDITKSILGTTTDAFGQVGLGILSPVEGKVDWLQNRFADMQDLIGDKEGAEKTRRKSEDQWGIVKELQENTDYFNKWSFLNNGGKQVFQGLGTSLLAMGEAGMGMALGGTEAAGSVVSLTNMGLGSAGSNENEARMRGASNAEAAIYGAISGTGEALSEMMFGGISRLSNTAGIGKGVFDSFDKEVADHFASKVNSKLAKTLIQYGISAASEGVEEIASGVVDAAAKKLTYMSDEQLSKLLADEKLMDAFVSSAISAGISQLPGVASNISNQKNGIYRDYLTNLSDNESKIIDAVVEERAKGPEITNKQKAEISDQVKKELFEGKLTTSEIDKALGDTTIYANPSDIYLNRIAVNERTNFTPIQSELEIDKSRINKNSSLEDIQNKVKLLQQDFLNQNNNIKNTTAAHELFNEMKSVIQATGEQVRLTSYNQLEQDGKVKLLTNKKGEAIRDKSGRKQYTDNKGNLIGINGFRDGQSGEIVLNSDSRAMFETTMGHEIGESLKANSPDSYKLLRELAVEVGRNDGTLTKETFDALKRAYGELGERTDSYLDEYVNDKIGELFDTNSNLINEISKKPSLLRSFINEIKYLVKKFTTTSPEGKRLLEAQHNLEKMLKKSISELDVAPVKNTKKTAFSVVGSEGLNNLEEFIKGGDYSTTALDLYNYMSEQLTEAKKMWDAGKSNKEITQSGNMWYNDGGKWKIEISNKNAAADLSKIINGATLDKVLKNQKLLFVMYPNLKQIKVDFKNMDGRDINASYSPKNNSIYVNDRFKGTKKDLTGTILHEVQHAIQRYENFEGGESSKHKYKYSSSLGEAEASLVSKRANLNQTQLEESDIFYKAQEKELLNRLKNYNKKTNYSIDFKDSFKNNVSKIYHAIDDAIYKMFERANKDVKNDTKNNIISSKNNSNNRIQNSELDGDYAESGEVDNTSFSNDTKYSLTDNQGRQLTEQQQEYFKDSKVRDDEGRLLEVYHGTTADFNTFDRGGGEHGEGYYFTEDYDYADEWSGGEDSDNRIVTAYLNLSNPLSSDVDLQSESMKKFIDGISAKWGLSEEDIKSCFEGSDAWEWSASLGAKVAESMGYGQEDVESIVGFEIDDPDDLGITDYNAYLGSYAWENGLNQLARDSGFDGIIAPIYNSESEGLEYIAFNSNQIKNVDNTNPTSNPDIRYSLSDNAETKDLQTRINESMTMDDMKRILDMAFVAADIEEYSEGAVKSVEDWLYNDDWNYQISLVAENTSEIIEKYLNRIDEDSGYNEDFTFDDILEAYKNGTLTGKEKQSRVSLDTSIKTDREDNRFYAPQTVEATQQLYDKANQRVTNKNRNEVYKARADFIIAAHDPDVANKLGISQQEINKKVKSWANYPQDAMRISNEVNKGIARENQWTGLENSSIVNWIAVSDEQLKSMVKEIKGNSSEYERKYITSAMLALDTHIDYSLLTFEFGQGEELSKRHANGDYNYQTDTIRVNRASQNTIAHEMGHYINSKWARDIFGSNPMGSPLSDLALHYNKDVFKLTPEQKNFVDNFTMFIDDLTDSAILSYGEHRGLDYWQNRDEVFARFVAKFTEWTKNKATNGRFDYESRYYSDFGDNFTQKQYMDFIKILQEKSALEAMGDRAERYSLTDNGNINPSDVNRNGIYTEQIKPQDIQEAIAPIKEQVQELQDTLDDIRYNIAPTVESEPTLNNPNIAPTGDAMELIDQQNGRNTFEKKTSKISSKKGGFKKAWDTVMSTVFNRNVLEDRLARKSGNQQIKYKADIRNNYMAEALTNITDHQTDINFNSIGQGVDSIFGELKALKIPPAVANEFLIDYSNIDRWRAGKGSQTPYEESAKRLRDYAIKYPQLKKWAKKVWQYGANSLQNRVDAGLISQQDADYMRKIYPHYVPYVNDVDNIDRIYQQTNDLSPQELKRARGGATKLLPVYEALTKYTMAEKNAIRTNDLFREIIKTYGQTEGIGFDERSHDTDLSQALISDASGNYLTAYEDGKQISTRIESDLFKELSKESERRIKEFEDNLSFITKPLQKANEFNRNIHTTWSLTFPGKNAFKDLGNALFNSKHTLRMAANYFPGMYELIRNNTDTVKQFKNAYGSGLTMGEFGNDTMNQKTKNIKFLNWVKSINEFIELAPRYAEFKASLQSGDSLQEAIYNAREVTMNFSRGGTIVKALNRNGATFLNSSVQGFDKIIRNFSGENGAKGVVSSLMKVALLGIAPAVFNDLAFGGGTDDEDEDYKALPNYDKDNYYLIKRDDGSFLRIPKSQLFAVLGSAARRTLEASRGEENAFEGFLSNAKSQIGVNNPVENNVFSPIIQLRKGDKMANGKTTGKTWYDDDIVPKRLQDKDANEQYDEKTDRFSVWLANTELGKKLNISPKKLNYLIDQYSGGVGDVVLPWITPEASSDAESLLDYAKATVKDQFVINSTDDNKYVSNFYSKNDELKNKADKDNATDEDKLRYKYTSHISSEMADLYKERREVQNDSSLSKKEKYEKASEIKRRINEFAKVGLDGNSNIVLEDNYAVVNGDMGYYKDKNGDWKPVAQSDIQATEGNGLTDKETSNYYATKNNISEVNSKYKGSKDYAGKKKDIVNEILKANIPDSAKIELYRDSYNDKVADKYVDAGISADSYLQFKAQTFEADKDKNGKSIINSKKQKVFDYVESMNIPFAQKVMLVKTEYPSYNEYNREVVNYLNNNPDIDYQTMKDILEDLGFEVNGDTISW